MSYNPNKTVDTDVCKAIEKLYESLKRKGITLRSIELSKELTLFGKPTKDIPLSFGVGYNMRHIKVTAPIRNADKIGEDGE